MKLNLRNKTFVFFLIISIIPLVLLLGLTLEFEQDLKENRFNEMKSHAHHMGLIVESYLEGGIRDINIISQNPVILSDTSDSEKIEELTRIVDIHPFYDDITIISTSGHSILSPTFQYRGQWLTNKGFQEAIYGKSSTSAAHLILEPKRLVVNFFAPMYKTDKIVSVVAAQLDLENVWRVIDTMEIGSGGYYVLLNNHNRILYHPIREKIYDKYEMSFENSCEPEFIQTTIDDVDVILTKVPLKLENLEEGCWQILAIQDIKEALYLSPKIQQRVFLVSIIAFIIALLLSILFSKSLIDPIFKLSKFTQKVSEGNLNLKINIKTKDELGRLADDFNNMLFKIRKSQQEIEEKTKEVEKTHAHEKAKLKELEKFRKLTIGRELKMIELKKKMKELEENKD